MSPGSSSSPHTESFSTISYFIHGFIHGLLMEPPILIATAPRRVPPPAQAEQGDTQPRTPAAPSDVGCTEVETR